VGSEMSCCDNREIVTAPKDDAIIDEYYSKRFSKEDLLFSITISNFKICIILSEKIENFFKNKNCLKIKNNDFYNHINITNCLNNNDLSLIVLEIELNRPFGNLLGSDHIKSNMYKLKEYFTEYRVNDFILISNDLQRIFELIKMNLSVMLKQQYVFMGVVGASKESKKEFKMLFKKISNIYEIGFTYQVYLHEGSLSQAELNKILIQNNDKILKSVISVPKIKDSNVIGKSYFFIFEKPTTKTNEYDFLVIEAKKKQMPDKVFYEDLANKLNSMQNHDLKYRLICVINDEDSLFLIMIEEQCELTIETSYPLEDEH